MNAAATVSVITISYRDAEGLRSTMASVAAQRHPHVEHIVIDGGTGPDAVELLDRSRVAYWQSRTDGGRYDAMNQGIQHARGDFLWFLHSSDVFADEHSVGTALRHLQDLPTPRASWGFGGARLSGGSRDGLVWQYTHFDATRFRLGVAPIPHQAAIFGRDVVEAVGGYSLDFGLAADHLFMMTASAVATPVAIPAILCHFDTGGAGSTRPQRDHFRDVRKAWKTSGVYPYRSAGLSYAASLTEQATATGKLAVKTAIGRAR